MGSKEDYISVLIDGGIDAVFNMTEVQPFLFCMIQNKRLFLNHNIKLQQFSTTLFLSAQRTVITLVQACK